MKDVEFLLDYLGIEKFSVLGTSGGGPFALAAAYYFSKKRLLKTLVMCGRTHPGYDQLSISLYSRWRRWAYRWIPSYHKSFEIGDVGAGYIEAYEKAKEQNDQKKMSKARAQYREVARQGTAGIANDCQYLSTLSPSFDPLQASKPVPLLESTFVVELRRVVISLSPS